MAVSVAPGHGIAHGDDDHGHDDIIYRETRDMRLMGFVLFLGAVIGAIDLILQLILVQGIPSLFSRR